MPFASKFLPSSSKYIFISTISSLFSSPSLKIRFFSSLRNQLPVYDCFYNYLHCCWDIYIIHHFQVSDDEGHFYFLFLFLIFNWVNSYYFTIYRMIGFFTYMVYWHFYRHWFFSVQEPKITSQVSLKIYAFVYKWNYYQYCTSTEHKKIHNFLISVTLVSLSKSPVVFSCYIGIAVCFIYIYYQYTIW